MATHKVTWDQGFRFTGEAAGGATTIFDAPGPDGEPATAPTPMENLLMSLAACSGVDVVSILKRMRQPLEGLEMEIEGDRVDDYPRVYTAIRVKFLVYGPVDQAKVERAVNLSTAKYCSVSAMLSSAAEISHIIEYRP